VADSREEQIVEVLRELRADCPGVQAAVLIGSDAMRLRRTCLRLSTKKDKRHRFHADLAERTGRKRTRKGRCRAVVPTRRVRRPRSRKGERECCSRLLGESPGKDGDDFVRRQQVCKEVVCDHMKMDAM